MIDNLDGQNPVIHPLTGASGFSINQQLIDRRHFQRGSGAERILLQGPAGRSLPLGYTLQKAPVIKELNFSANILTNRVGVQLAAQVVLPRTQNPETGRPYELLVRSAQYGSGGRWETVRLNNLPQLLAGHTRVARARHGTSLDEREAYVSHLVFLAPGGPGVTELVVDQIQGFGITSNQHNEPLPPLEIYQAAAEPQTKKERSRSPKQVAAVATEKHRFARIPRIIKWQGESFELLQKIGFNTIGMTRLPTSEQLQQASQLGLSLVCPPPSPQQLTERGIGKEYLPVLAWDLGEQLSADDLAQTDRWERLVRRHDPLEARPTIITPHLHTLEASRIADVLLVGRATVGTELTVREHAAWLSQRKRLARPGTPIWTKIETQLSPQHQQQIIALGANELTVNTTYGQLTSLTSASLGVKTRGFYFQSQMPLIEAAAENQTKVKPSLAAQRRTMHLELINMRLQLTEPWLVAGKEVTAARSSQPELSALVMQAEQSHLLVPTWWSGDMQAATPPRTAGPVSFIVPGVGESSEVYLVTLGGLQRVRHERVTGGIRAELEALPFDSFLLFSSDPRAMSQVTRYVRRIAPRATKIRRELVAMRLQNLIGMMSGLQSPKLPESQNILQRAQGELAACDRYFNSRNYELAYMQADAADLVLDQLEEGLHQHFQSANTLARANYGPITLVDRMRLDRFLARAPIGANLLPGGGFENLATLLNSGWRHKQLPLDGIESSVRLSPEAPHSGSYCLELEAHAVDTTVPAVVVPTSPVWIATTPLSVRSGDLLEITGVARLPEPLVGSVDGLQIIDSLGGPEMALRIHEAPSWQPFRLIRTATGDANVSVTIALSGLGKAQVDDVAVRVIRK